MPRRIKLRFFRVTQRIERMIELNLTHRAQCEWCDALGGWQVFIDADVDLIQRGVRSLKYSQRIKR